MVARAPIRTPELSELETFVLAVDEGSLARAAERLHISRPAAAKRIRHLEALAGEPLLTRGRRGVQATATGVRVYPLARELMAKRDEMIAVLGGGPPSDVLRFAGMQQLLGHVPAPPAEEQLRDTQSVFAAVFHATADAIVVARASDGTVCELNQSAAELIGGDQASLRGQTVSQVLEWQDESRRDDLVARAVRIRRPHEGVFVLRTADGAVVAVRVRFEVIELRAEVYVLMLMHPLHEPSATAPMLAAGARTAIPDHVLARFLTALLAGAAEAAQEAAEAALTGGADGAGVHARLIAPAMREIGERWERNAVTIAGEHLATEICHQVAARILWRSARATPGSGPRVLLAAAPGERHVLGLRLTADVLVGAGHDVLYLGADTPEHALLQACREHRPAVVGLTVALPEAVPGLRQAADRLAEMPGAPRLMIGGRAAAWAARRGVPAAVVGDCDEAPAVVAELASASAAPAGP